MFLGRVGRVKGRGREAGGADRYETAARIAEVDVEAGMTWDGVGVATGADFPDALSGGGCSGLTRACCFSRGRPC